MALGWGAPIARCEAQASHWRLKAATSTPLISNAYRPNERRKSMAVSQPDSSDRRSLVSCPSRAPFAVPVSNPPLGALSSRFDFFRQSIFAPLSSA